MGSRKKLKYDSGDNTYDVKTGHVIMTLIRVKSTSHNSLHSVGFINDVEAVCICAVLHTNITKVINHADKLFVDGVDGVGLPRATVHY
jgi:hypothetical protein